MRSAAILHSFARPPWPWLFAAAGCGLAVSAGLAGGARLPAFCGALSAGLQGSAGWSGALWWLFELNRPGRLAMEWALMLLAMMPPLLAVPLMHVRRFSLPRRRLRAMGLFVLGYGAAWMAAGLLLVTLALLLQLLAGRAALPAALLLAAAWSAGPSQRAALNRSHRLGRIGLFGARADRDCLAFGGAHGAWCVASCWAWMIVPLAAGRWHLPAMVLAGTVMLAQRLAPPGVPRWGTPPALALFGFRIPWPRSRLAAGRG